MIRSGRPMPRFRTGSSLGTAARPRPQFHRRQSLRALSPFSSTRLSASGAARDDGAPDTASPDGLARCRARSAAAAGRSVAMRRVERQDLRNQHVERALRNRKSGWRHGCCLNLRHVRLALRLAAGQGEARQRSLEDLRHERLRSWGRKSTATSGNPIWLTVSVVKSSCASQARQCGDLFQVERKIKAADRGVGRITGQP